MGLPKSLQGSKSQHAESEVKIAPDHVHDLDGVVRIFFVLELYETIPDKERRSQGGG